MSLKIYTKILTYKENASKSIYLVKNEIDGLLYVHRILTEYNKDIYMILQTIHHPNLPKIYEIVEHENTLHIIEEYFNYPTLDYYVLNHEINDNEKQSVIQQICDAVIILHQNHIIHRDIKPENIFYDRQRAILFDFDISRCYRPKQDKDTAVLGSIGYAAPEQFGFQQTDERTDVYALGVLIHYIYTEHWLNEVSYQGKYKPVIEKATQLDPLKRYQSVDELKKSILLVNNNMTSWTLPGFRSGVHFNKVVASICYGLLIVCTIFLDFEGVKKGTFEDIMNRIVVFGFICICIAFTCNYKNINRFSLFRKHKIPLIRYVGILLSLSLTLFVFMVIMAICMIPFS